MLFIQWEYQVGPCPGVEIGDHLQMSRYILLRLGEQYGLRVSLKSVLVHGESFFSGGHLNFSVRKMREKGGIKYAESFFYLSKNNINENKLRKELN